MSNVVLGYPKISKADFEWIQGIREVNDRQYKIVKPHITFVFPTSKLPVVELASHIRRKASNTPRIAIALSKAAVVQDDSKKFFHVFLVPAAGYEEIVRLHDLLYTDVLSSELREDIPFIPHVGIATSESEATARDLANKLNATGVNVVGSVDALAVSEFDGNLVRDVEEIALRST